jgi:hypothetical protein
VWNQQAKLSGTDALSNAQLGFSISLSGDGNTAMIGGPGPFDNRIGGAAWVFTRAGGVWSQQAKLVGTGAVGGALQGYSVSLSSDGDFAIVGGLADNNDAGAAWVYVRFAGVPGSATCIGQSVQSLIRYYRGLNTAAGALGFSNVAALQNAILMFCSE